MMFGFYPGDNSDVSMLSGVITMMFGFYLGDNSDVWILSGC